MSTGARRLLFGLATALLLQGAAAQANKPAPSADLGVVDWLQRMHQAARQHSYAGTFVVSPASGNLSALRIWHTFERDAQIEKIETLTGPQRVTIRRNDAVTTLWPQARVARSEVRESRGLFPGLRNAPDAAIAELYSVKMLGQDRVAGFDADVLALMPRDGLRFGYRIWSERRSGLVIRLETLNAEGRVVEQSAFSELQIDPPIKARTLTQHLQPPAGFRVDTLDLEATSVESEGWKLKAPVTGFRATRCYRRAIGAASAGDRTLQCTFSDGLASVSVFVKPYDATAQPREVLMTLGATHTLTRRLADQGGDWWLTVVGEVPPQTLDAFAQGLVRTR